jgi:hypothetical protein
MISFVVSQLVVSRLSMVLGTIGLVTLLALIVLANDREKPGLEPLSKNATVFLIPMLMVFGYLVLLWAVRILTG